MWFFLLSIEISLAFTVIFVCVGLSVMNATFLYMMVDKLRQKQDRFFKFDVDFKWLSPNTVYIPFEFKLLLSNFYIVRLSVFGKGFQVDLKWFDAQSSVLKENGNKPNNSSKRNKSDKPKKSDKPEYMHVKNSQKLKRVNELPMDLLIKSGKQKRDLNNTSTQNLKKSLRHYQANK